MSFYTHPVKSLTSSQHGKQTSKIQYQFHAQKMFATNCNVCCRNNILFPDDYIIIIKAVWKDWGKCRHYLNLGAEVTDSIQATTFVFTLEIALVNIRSVLLLFSQLQIIEGQLKGPQRLWDLRNLRSPHFLCRHPILIYIYKSKLNFLCSEQHNW
jgi:hypothetical protein